MLTTQAQVRAAFWDAFPELEAIARRRRTFSKGQNAQITDTRVAFCDYIDSLARDGQITEKLAARVTL
jgi:hypothetical protein